MSRRHDAVYACAMPPRCFDGERLLAARLRAAGGARVRVSIAAPFDKRCCHGAMFDVYAV